MNNCCRNVFGLQPELRSIRLALRPMYSLLHLATAVRPKINGEHANAMSMLSRPVADR